MVDEADKAREEFFSEAQELVDGLGRDLLTLDAVVRQGGADVDLVNDVFRAVHTLKGIAGLFGAARMSGLSHELEDVLDDLRLGRVELGPRVMDLLFQAVELYSRLLAAEKGDAPEPVAEVEGLLVSLGQLTQHRGGGGVGLVAQYDLDPGLLGVLTEYEEHRLRTNIQSGLSLYRIRVRFSLATIDSALDDLKAKARPHGEIITYLPTGAGGDIETIELEILMASQAGLDILRGAIEGPHVSVEEVRRRGRGPVPVSVAPPATHTSLLPPPPGQSPSVPPPPLPRPAAPGGPPGGVPSSQGVSRPRGEPAGAPSSAPFSPPAPRTVRHLSVPPPAPTGVQPAGPASVMAIPPAALSRDASLRSVSQTVRVDIRKLDRLMTVVGELAIVRSAMARLEARVRGRPELREVGLEIQRLHRSFDRHLDQMQGGILEVRMVPLGQAFDKLARVVRQISREHDKQVNLVVTGAETEIDKLIVEELSDPLMHMIRNAIDHGIEPREERLRHGKPPVGTIALNAFQKGNQVVIEVEDDGAGMDPQLLVEAAVRRGLVTDEEASEMTPREILGLVFVPGFTTKEIVTEVSGRGVGLDVVKTNIAKLGGIVDITSEVLIGTKMTITLPITLAIISVLMVEVSGRSYAVPLASVDEAIALDEGQVRVVEGREILTVRGQSLPICRLAALFGMEEGPQTSRLGRMTKAFAVVAKVGGRRLGFVVDRLVGQEDIVIKALGKSLKDVRGFAGATELGDQRVALVLDVATLLEEVLTGDQGRLLAASEGRA